MPINNNNSNMWFVYIYYFIILLIKVSNVCTGDATLLYKGCFIDLYGGVRDIAAFRQDDSSMTIDMCKEICAPKDYRYMALQVTFSLPTYMCIYYCNLLEYILWYIYMFISCIVLYMNPTPRAFFVYNSILAP